MAKLHLQNELADQPLVIGRRQRSINRQFAVLQALDVRREVVLVLVVRAADLPERGHTQREQVGAGPKPVAINKARLRLILHRSVGATDDVAVLLQFGERLADPAALGFPIGDRRAEFALGLHLFVDAGVVRHLHLVNRHAVRRHPAGALDAGLPVFLGLIDHAGDEIDVDLGEAQPLGELIRAPDLRAAVSAAVHLEDVVVEILHAEAQPRDTDLAQHLEFLLAQRARLALERDLLHLVPRQ